MKDKEKLENFKSSSKVYSSLRMIANGSNVVNTIRSRSNKCISTQKPKISKEEAKSVSSQVSDEGYNQVSQNLILDEISTAKAKSRKSRTNNLKKKDLADDPPTEIILNVFIQLKSDFKYNDVIRDIYPEMKKRDITSRVDKASILGNIVQDTIVATEIDLLKKCDYVVSIEGTQAIQLPPIQRLALTSSEGPKAKVFKNIDIQSKSKDVIIGIIDVGGFDFAHIDFLNKSKTKTRFTAIWDQGGNFRKPPNKVLKDFKKYNYGSLIEKSNMDEAIRQAKKVKVPVHALEPQSQQSPASHATHVASIAAGNSGICSGADIVGVLISLPREDEGSIEESRSNTFTDSARITDAVDFLLDYAEKEDKSISINISLGTNGHAHDGSSPVNRWIDARLAKEGRCICVATGNSGQEKGTDKDDFGYIMGRIHSSGRISNKGLMADLEWHVIGDGIEDVSENELEIWYQPQDRFSVQVKPPGLPWVGPVKPQEFIENQQLSDYSFLSIYNKIYHQANGSNQIGIYLSPNLNKDQIIGIRPGLWRVRLIGEEIRDGNFDCWIERDDPHRRAQEFWNFPSFFSEKTNVDNKSINSLACGMNVIAVGNYDAENDRINITSGQGPTRDNRKKPEIVAPGTNIIAASGFTGDHDEWTSKTGTSMASPYACGVAGLLLTIQSKLTSSQIAGIFKRTCSPVAGLNYEWKNDTGFGIINIDASIAEANSFMYHNDITE